MPHNHTSHNVKESENDLLTTMPIQGRVKCLSPQNTSEVFGVASVADKFNTIKVIGDRIFKRKKTTLKT